MKKSILYVLHEGKAGGVFHNVHDIISNLTDNFESYLLFSERHELQLYKYEDDELQMIQKYSKDMWNFKDFKSSWLSYVYFDVLLKNNIDIVHINHLINHSLDLPEIAHLLGIKVVLTFHDYYFMCPYYTLINEKQEYCAGKCPDNNLNCYNPNIVKNINSKKIIDSWRKNINDMFSYVDYFIAPSIFTKNLFLSIYGDRSKINENNFLVIEHGGDYPELTEEIFEFPSESEKIKILFPANYLSFLKGSNLIKQIKKYDKNNLLDFYFMGHVDESLEKYGKSYGTYKREDFQKIVKEIKPSFIGIFSICPETFCYTLSESWSCGIPLIGTNIGVIQERIKLNDGGWIIDYTNPKKAYETILDLAKNKEEYSTKQKNVKNIYLRNTKEMTENYIELYNLL